MSLRENASPGDGRTAGRGRIRRARLGFLAAAVTTVVGCASLFVDATGYFDDSVVGALDITDSGRLTGFQVLDPVVSGYEVFLAGEAHGVAENLDYACAQFQYLHDRRGVSTYLAEIGFAAGEQLNAYVQGIGSDVDLTTIVDASRGTYAWTREWFAFWRRLRLWNARLAPERKIRVVGIDVEHQVDRGFAYVAELLPQTEPGAAIAPVVSELRGWTPAADSASARDLAERADDSLARDAPAWQEYLTDGFHPVRIAVRGIVRRYEFYDDPSDSDLREAAIYENFVDVYQHILGADERRMFGLWGSVHVARAPVDGFSSIGARLQNGVDSPVAGAVFAIVAYYDRSTAMRTFPYRTVPLSSDRLVIRLFAPYATTVATLFYLDGEASPFRSSPALSPDGRTPTTEVYQAAVLYSRARASTPLGGH